MKFKLLNGTHRHHDGKKYKAGQTLESHLDLCGKFINRFERVTPVDAIKEAPKTSSPETKEAVIVVEKSSRKGSPAKRFQAKHASGGRYNVIDSTTGEKINKAFLSKEQALAMEK